MHLFHATFRHYRRDEDGRDNLIWGSTLGEIPMGEVIKGTKHDREAIRAQLWLPNNLIDEGEEDILKVYLSGTAAPTNFYFRLYTGSAPADTATLTSLSASENVGTGYPGTNTVERSAVGWPTFALDAGDWKGTSKTITWTAGGTWTASLTQMILATVQTGSAGKALAYRTLTAARSLVLNDTLDANIGVKLA